MSYSQLVSRIREWHVRRPLAAIGRSTYNASGLKYADLDLLFTIVTLPSLTKAFTKTRGTSSDCWARGRERRTPSVATDDTPCSLLLSAKLKWCRPDVSSIQKWELYDGAMIEGPQQGPLSLPMYYWNSHDALSIIFRYSEAGGSNFPQFSFGITEDLSGAELSRRGSQNKTTSKNKLTKPSANEIRVL